MRFKRLLCGLMAAVLSVSMVGCGGKGGSSAGKSGGEGSVVAANKASHFFRAEYLENLPAEFTEINSASFVGDDLYYVSYGADYNTPLIGRINILTGDSSVIWKKTTNDEINVSAMSADAEGNAYVFFRSRKVKQEAVDRYADATEDDIIKVIEDWGFGSHEEAEKYWNDELKKTVEDKSIAEIMVSIAGDYDNDFINEDTFVKFDASGNEVFNNKLEAAGGNVETIDIKADKDGNVLALTADYGEDEVSYAVNVYKNDGSYSGKIFLDGYCDSLMVLADGRVAYTLTGDTTFDIVPLDVANNSKGEPIQISGLLYAGHTCALSDNEFLVNVDTNVTKVNTQTGESEKYLTWLDSNIMSYYVRDFTALSDGTIGVYMESYGTTSSTDLAVLREISEEEASKITGINVVCFYADSRLQNAALEFNKKHSDYHIYITEYYDFANNDIEYADAMDSFVTDCATDSSIDVVSFPNYSQMIDFADKGLLIDLSQYMATDEVLKKENIIPGIVDAFTFKDKFVALPSSYRIETLVGKKSVVGDTPGWTVKECLDAYEKTGALCITQYTDRAAIMNTLISLNGDEFIDMENGTCNFNNQDFQDVLALAAKYPEKYEYNEETNMMDDYKTGKQLLYTDSLPEFTLSQALTSVGGEDAVFIGYPTSNGNGAMMSFYGMTGITINCKAPEMMWEFMRIMYMPESIEYYGGSEYYNGSILASELDKYFESAKEWKDRGEYGYDAYNVELKTPTDAEINTMRDIINNTTAVSDSVSTAIMNIISEEAAGYFSGEKSASDVAAVVQSRVDIYLSETR